MGWEDEIRKAGSLAGPSGTQRSLCPSVSITTTPHSGAGLSHPHSNCQQSVISLDTYV